MKETNEKNAKKNYNKNIFSFVYTCLSCVSFNPSSLHSILRGLIISKNGLHFAKQKEKFYSHIVSLFSSVSVIVCSKRRNSYSNSTHGLHIKGFKRTCEDLFISFAYLLFKTPEQGVWESSNVLDLLWCCLYPERKK